MGFTYRKYFSGLFAGPWKFDQRWSQRNSLGACLALPLEFNQEKECLFKRHNEQGVALLYWTDLPKQFIALLMIYSPKLMLSLPTIPSVYTHRKHFETIPSILGQFKENKTCKLKWWSFLSALI